MAIKKYNSTELKSVGETISEVATSFGSLGGIHLIYQSSAGKLSLLSFYGEDYAPENLQQQSVLKSWKRVFSAFWETYAWLDAHKGENASIRTKLVGAAPAAICVSDGKTAKYFNVASSVWASLGFKPSASDLKRFNDCKTDKERGKVIFKAAIVAFEALKFKVNFEKYEAKPQAEGDKAEAAA